MFPVTCSKGGTCVTPGPTDVCKTPAAPSPIPGPYPNIVNVNQAKSGSCAKKVKVENKPMCTVKTEVPMSSGDEAGSIGGMVSSKIKGPGKYKQGCSKVKAQGNMVVRLLSMISQNGGDNGNMPAGTQVAPSQTKVILLSP